MLHVLCEYLTLTKPTDVWSQAQVVTLPTGLGARRARQRDGPCGMRVLSAFIGLWFRGFRVQGLGYWVYGSGVLGFRV